MATAGCRTKLSYKEVKRPNVFPHKWKIKAYSKKGWLIFINEGTEAFIERLAL